MDELYASYDKARADLFAACRDPGLSPGYVSLHYRVEPDRSDLFERTAPERLKQRLQSYPWRRLGADAPFLQPLREWLVRQAGGASADQAQAEADRLDESAYRQLCFYEQAWLVHLPGATAFEARRIVAYRPAGAAASEPYRFTLLTGEWPPIAQLNRDAGFRFDCPHLEEYVAFACEHLHRPGGAYNLMEHSAPVEGEFGHFHYWMADKPAGVFGGDNPAGGETCTAAVRIAHPVVELSRSDEAALFIATALQGSDLLRSAYRIGRDGKLELAAERPITGVSPSAPDLAWSPGEGR